MKRAFAACLMICAFVAGICTMAWAAEMVNINTATEAELMKLDKIGAAKAAEIIKYRNEHGPFTRIDDLKKVKGIGDATFELNKARIVTDLPKTAADAAEKTKAKMESSSPAADAKDQAADAVKKAQTGVESAIPSAVPGTKKK